MPKYERYPNESPIAAKRRISKNISRDASTAKNPRLPRAGRAGAPATKASLMKGGYNIARNIGETPDIGY